ncbi:MAG: methionine/alanine import family NSS transporter small subunit [Propionibacteriaceae bacterium]|nr:methionine/alanine import family NSS transporter small subunit [Propionibacteriaceae bacterium]
MSPIAIALMAISMFIIWGGLAASAVFLVRNQEVTVYPEGYPQNH